MKTNKPRLWVHGLFLGPSILVFSIGIVAPFLVSCFYSLTDWNGVSRKLTFIGLQNFVDIFTGKTSFLNALSFTVTLSVFNIILVVALGTLVALLVTSKIPLRNVTKTIFYLPYTIGGMVLGFVWQYVFLEALPSIGKLLHISALTIPWLGYENTAFFALGIVFVWQNLGYVMVIISSGLISISKEVLESAKIDGAGSITTFFKIKVPQIIPYISTCVFWTTACAFKMFELSLAMTKGGPYGSTRTLALNIYYEAFSNNMYGMATAESLIFILIMSVIVLTQRIVTNRLEKKWL